MALRMVFILVYGAWLSVAPWIALVIALTGDPLAGAYLVAIWVVSFVGPVLSQEPLDGSSEFQ